MATEALPDLSHLTEEERLVIEQVLNRQKAEDAKTANISRCVSAYAFL